MMLRLQFDTPAAVVPENLGLTAGERKALEEHAAEHDIPMEKMLAQEDEVRRITGRSDYVYKPTARPVQLYRDGTRFTARVGEGPVGHYDINQAKIHMTQAAGPAPNLDPLAGKTEHAFDIGEKDNFDTNKLSLSVVEYPQQGVAVVDEVLYDGKPPAPPSEVA
jgi:hypothetical protein